MSAWTGRNATDGALGAFLDAVREERIDSDSWLLVEDLDRISRQSINKSIRLLIDIIDLGITIVVIGQNNQIYNKEAIAKDPYTLIYALMTFARGNNESEVKSMRLKEQYKQALIKARDNNILISRRRPSWISYDPNTKSFGLIPEKVKVVQYIVQKTLEGIGGRVLSKMLNEQNIPLLGGGRKENAIWTQSHIKKTIEKPSLYGEYVSKGTEHESIPNYYPAIITRDEFVRMQEIKSNRTRKRTTKSTWLLSGQLWCVCGQKYRTQGGRQICLSQYHNAGCDAPSISHAVMAHTVIVWFYQLYGKEFILPKDEKERLEKEITELKRRQRNLLSLVEDADDPKIYNDRINELTKEIKTKENELAGIRRKRPIEKIYEEILTYCAMIINMTLSNKDNTLSDQITRYTEQLKILLNRVIDKIIIYKEIYYSKSGDYYYRLIDILGNELSEILGNKRNNIGIRVKLPKTGIRNEKRVSQLRKGEITITDIDIEPNNKKKDLQTMICDKFIDYGLKLGRHTTSLK